MLTAALVSANHGLPSEAWLIGHPLLPILLCHLPCGLQCQVPLQLLLLLLQRLPQLARALS